MLENRLNYISVDVIFCVWGQYVFRVAENCSCEVQHRL